MRRSGFTLMETLIVVAIIGILAAIVIPTVASSRSQTIESAVRQLLGDLRLARSLAIQYGTEYTVEFDLEAHTYELTHSGTGTAPTPVDPLAPDQQSGTYEVDFNRLAKMAMGGDQVRISLVELTDTNEVLTDVTFGPLGGTGPSRSEDTSIWLSQGTDDDERSLQLTISWVTGMVWIKPIESSN